MALSPSGLCCLVWKAQGESFALMLRGCGAPGIRERGSPSGEQWEGRLWALGTFRAGLGPRSGHGPRATLPGVSPCALPRPGAPPSPTPGTAQRGQAPLPGDAGRRGCDIQGVWSQGPASRGSHLSACGCCLRKAFQDSGKLFLITPLSLRNDRRIRLHEETVQQEPQ